MYLSHIIKFAILGSTGVTNRWADLVYLRFIKPKKTLTTVIIIPKILKLDMNNQQEQKQDQFFLNYIVDVLVLKEISRIVINVSKSN